MCIDPPTLKMTIFSEYRGAVRLLSLPPPAAMRTKCSKSSAPRELVLTLACLLMLSDKRCTQHFPLPLTAEGIKDGTVCVVENQEVRTYFALINCLIDACKETHVYVSGFLANLCHNLYPRANAHVCVCVCVVLHTRVILHSIYC